MGTYHKGCLDRRCLLGAGLALLAPPALAVQPRSMGCALKNTPESRRLLAHAHFGAAAGGDFGGVGYDTSGDPRFDRLLGLLLADLSLRNGVRPGFGFYDDGTSPNAYALSDTRLPGTKGTVLFGRAMLRKALADTANGDMFVMGICAHEFGHIVQYSSAVRARLTGGQQTGKLLELHADFLAGHYIGLRNEKYSPSELVALGRSWESIGDTAYTNPTHHGTPEERISAMEQGFQIARDRPQFTMAAICEVGARYLGV